LALHALGTNSAGVRPPLRNAPPSFMLAEPFARLRRLCGHGGAPPPISLTPGSSFASGVRRHTLPGVVPLRIRSVSTPSSPTNSVRRKEAFTHTLGITSRTTSVPPHCAPTHPLPALYEIYANSTYKRHRRHGGARRQARVRQGARCSTISVVSHYLPCT
jgi:hypothetical protein